MLSILVVNFHFQQELYALEKSKQMQPLQRFDLSFGLKKPIKNRRVLSMVNVQLVKPVEQNQGVNILSVKAFDSPQVPTKSEADKNTFIISNEKIDEANARIRNLNVKVREKKVSKFYSIELLNGQLPKIYQISNCYFLIHSIVSNSTAYKYFSINPY